MYLSKSKYCQGYQCIKMLWLDKYLPQYKSDIGNNTQLENGTDVGILAKRLFGKYKDVSFNEDLSKMIDETKEYLNDDKVIVTEASFNYEGNFCSVDILKKNGNNYEIYEVKSSTEISDIYVQDIGYQYYVLNKLGFNVTKCSLVYLNSKYVRYGELELNKLFNICDVTEKIILIQNEISNKIKEINEYMEQKDELNIDIGIHCVNPYECPYFDYCSRNLDKPNAFSIHGMSNKKKFEMYHNGKYKFVDLINEEMNPKYLEQIMYEINDMDSKIEKEEIKDFLDILTYPIYYLDFETYQQAIPEFDGVRPYMQIPFQYSLHYRESLSSELKHKEFLGDGVSDPRRSLAESLVRDIPKDSCVLAYNMSFEKGRIKEMAEIFPDLSEHLMNIYNNIKDLMIPFQKRNYYCRDMQGSYSIKYVLPALFPNDASLNYHSLEMVHNGVEAMNSYSNLHNLSLEEQKKLRYNMLRYCELDTYAMVKIHEKLLEIVEEGNDE